MLIDNLIQLGLSEKEAEVYLMLLRIGPSPASSLARRINVKRVTVYSVLDSLSARGLVTFEENGNCRKYIPHDPECLLYGLEKQNAELKVRIELAKDCIEKLQESRSLSRRYSHKTTYSRGFSSVSRTLTNKIDGSSDIFVIFLNFGKKLQSADCLWKFLEKNRSFSRKIYLCVPEEKLNMAKRAFPGVICTAAKTNSDFVNGELLVQDDKVFFIFSEKDDLQMMQVNDTSYADFIRGTLLSQYFDLQRQKS